METNLPIALVQHLERIGCLPRTHDEDGIDDLDYPPANAFEHVKVILDENGEPPF